MYGLPEETVCVPKNLFEVVKAPRRDVLHATIFEAYIGASHLYHGFAMTRSWVAELLDSIDFHEMGKGAERFIEPSVEVVGQASAAKPAVSKPVREMRTSLSATAHRSPRVTGKPRRATSWTKRQIDYLNAWAAAKDLKVVWTQMRLAQKRWKVNLSGTFINPLKEMQALIQSSRRPFFH